MSVHDGDSNLIDLELPEYEALSANLWEETEDSEASDDRREEAAPDVDDDDIFPCDLLPCHAVIDLGDPQAVGDFLPQKDANDNPAEPYDTKCYVTSMRVRARLVELRERLCATARAMRDAPCLAKLEAELADLQSWDSTSVNLAARSFATSQVSTLLASMLLTMSSGLVPVKKVLRNAHIGMLIAAFAVASWTELDLYDDFDWHWVVAITARTSPEFGKHLRDDAEHIYETCKRRRLEPSTA